MHMDDDWLRYLEEWPQEYALSATPRTVMAGRSIRPIHLSDAEVIRVWRNSQMGVLRQNEPITRTQQLRYFLNDIQPQFSARVPTQMLYSLVIGDELIGYGGLVHISWPSRRAELSFLSATDRASGPVYETDFSTFLHLVTAIAVESLQLHKLTTETYANRRQNFSILESFGFRLEGKMSDQEIVEGDFKTSYAHGLVLPGSATQAKPK